MPKLSKLSLITSALMLAISPAAFAQDDTPEMTPEVQNIDSFTSADIDADGALDRDEFVSFVVMKSDEGEADYEAIKNSGEYDNHFNTKDYNADGLLTAEELKLDGEDNPEVMPKDEAPGGEPIKP